MNDVTKVQQMPKMTITEKDIHEIATHHAIPGELPLTGVYGSLDKFPEALTAGLMAGLVTGSAAGGAVGGALSNQWALFFANDQRIVIAVLGYINAETRDAIQLRRQDIQDVKIKNGLFMRKFKLRLVNGQKITFKAQKSFVFGHPHHKERMTQLTQYLRGITMA